MKNNKPTAVRWRIMALLVLASFTSYVLRYNTQTAAPVMIEDLALSEIQWSWVLAAFTAGYALFQLPGGVLGDRFGPRRVLTVIAILWTVFTVLTAVVPGPEVLSAFWIVAGLMAVRFLVGATHAPIFPLVNTSVIRWFPVGSWGFPQGLSSAGLTVGVAVSAPVVAWLISEFGWRMSFAIISPLGVLVALAWWRVSRDDPRDHPGCNQAEEELIAQGREALHGEDGGHWYGILKNRNVLLLTLSYSSMNYVYYIVFNWFFYYLVNERGFELTAAGFVTSAQWIAGAAGAMAGGWVCDRFCRRIGLRWGCRWPIVIGMLVSAVLLLLGASQADPVIAAGMLALCFFFNQFNEAPYWTTSMAVGGRQAGAAGGVMNTGANLMGVVNSLLVAYIASTLGWTAAIGSGALFAVVGAGLMLLVRADETVKL